MMNWSDDDTTWMLFILTLGLIVFPLLLARLIGG